MSWLRYPPPWRWVLLVLDTVILASLGVGTVMAASHIIGMWRLQNEYAIAARCRNQPSQLLENRQEGGLAPLSPRGLLWRNRTGGGEYVPREKRQQKFYVAFETSSGTRASSGNVVARWSRWKGRSPDIREV